MSPIDEVRITLTHPQQLAGADYLSRDAAFSQHAQDATKNVGALLTEIDPIQA
ncbi:hypothetical protein [Paraburkholderia sp. BL10I2N1]|uniref:hypothetical protein n=1 Tax=Paraburkholderia sp. BL10I2N1 TaxID=1938796 RepID=UPI001414D1A3|nr:hypothetical protein [Paraburkholderia sp. BL10I2N1]